MDGVEEDGVINKEMDGEIKEIMDGEIKEIMDGEIKEETDGEIKGEMDGEMKGTIMDGEEDSMDSKVFGETTFKEMIGFKSRGRRMNIIFLILASKKSILII